MNSSEKFCLKWDDFSENVITAFQDLRQDTDFSDVTLAGEGKQQITAHKVILAAFSHFFRNVLKHYKHPHHFLYMRGVKPKYLTAIVDFLYHGEVNIFQKDLGSSWW